MLYHCDRAFKLFITSKKVNYFQDSVLILKMDMYAEETLEFQENIHLFQMWYLDLSKVKYDVFHSQ